VGARGVVPRHPEFSRFALSINIFRNRGVQLQSDKLDKRPRYTAASSANSFCPK
jgi:hypothetical protein